MSGAGDFIGYFLILSTIYLICLLIFAIHAAGKDMNIVIYVGSVLLFIFVLSILISDGWLTQMLQAESVEVEADKGGE